MSSAEVPGSMPLQIARTLACKRTNGMIHYQLDQLRLGWHIHQHFSQEQVFTIYANRAYFGPGMTGIENASRQLFHKESDALSIKEAALIAGLIRSPSAYSPYKHADKALQRRNKVLELMKIQGKLSADDATKMEMTPLGIEE
jgi:membrane peptidoglycan carboxypeptidase